MIRAYLAQMLPTRCGDGWQYLSCHASSVRASKCAHSILIKFGRVEMGVTVDEYVHLGTLAQPRNVSRVVLNLTKLSTDDVDRSVDKHGT